jgi:hypothetical protein
MFPLRMSAFDTAGFQRRESGVVSVPFRAMFADLLVRGRAGT